MIRIKNMTQSIQGKAILKDISVDIKKGRLTSLIGPNGAGKSTLLSAISRIIEHDSGVIELEDIDIAAYRKNLLAQKLSILKQTNHTDMNITVEQ
nr:ATP-binding cassette domain-containing protein [Staphylococcus lugdunensis]